MTRTFSPLARKLWRDLWRIKGQALAIVLVIAAGISLMVMSRGMMVSLEATMQTYYERSRFADIYVPIVRAPQHMIASVRDLEGVADAQPRIVGAALIDIENTSFPISARILSIDSQSRSRINDITLTAGRMINPGRPDEILLLEPFAEAHGLAPGDSLSVTVNSSRRQYKIAGLVYSPEFIYAIPPGEFVSNPARFAVMWASEEELAAAFDMDGAFNEVLLTLSNNAIEQDLLDQLDRLFENNGAVGAYARSDQLSNRFMVEELAQLSTMSKVMPPIFLAVAVFLLNVVITRLVQTERMQIGLLKAFGYTNRTVALHYLKFALIIATAGGVVGWLGGLWLGRLISEIYQLYFYFPYLIYIPGFQTFGLSLMIGIAGALIGAFFAVRAAAVLNPAVAMRPPVPPVYARAGPLSRIFEHLMDQPSRMVIRRLTRQAGRSGLTVLGIGAAMALSVMMRFNSDATDYMLDVSFNVVDRSDARILFTDPLSINTLYNISAIDGVTNVEPVRFVPVQFKNGLYDYIDTLTGLPDSPVLNRPVDAQLRQVEIPSHGIVLSEHLAETLQVVPGDMLTVEVREGLRPVLSIPVAGLVEALIGTPAYIKMDTLNRYLNEPLRISGAYMEIDDNKTAQVYSELKGIPKVAGISLNGEAYRSFEEAIDEGPGTFRSIMTVFSVIIAAGVVYNSARIAYIERSHDLASLRVLGFTRAETGYVLLGELIVLIFLALPIGSYIGYLLWVYLTRQLSTDLYQLPVVYNPDGLGYAALIVIIAGCIAGVLIQRDISKLDMVSALKIRE